MTWREKSLWGWSCGKEAWELGRLLRLINEATSGASIDNGELSSTGSLNSSEVSGQETGVLVRSIKGVNKGVQSFASSAWWDIASAKDSGNLWCKFSTILVEGKITVSGIMWVDEGVEVRVYWIIIVVWDLGLRGR